MELTAKIIGLVALLFGVLLICPLITWLLWNRLMPQLFNLPRLTFWQSWGIVVLAHAVFPSNSITKSTK